MYNTEQVFIMFFDMCQSKVLMNESLQSLQISDTFIFIRYWRHVCLPTLKQRLLRSILKMAWKMNATISWNSSGSSNDTFIRSSRPYHDKVDYNVSNVYKFISGGIAIVSVLGNFLLCVAICRRRSLLSKTYNMLVLSLAVTDMLTG